MAITLPREKVSLWGSEYSIRPTLIEQKIGDGKVLLVYSPMDYRPHYFLLRVDTTWDDQHPADLIESIFQAIQGEVDLDDWLRNRGYQPGGDWEGSSWQESRREVKGQLARELKRLQEREGTHGSLTAKGEAQAADL